MQEYYYEGTGEIPAGTKRLVCISDEDGPAITSLPPLPEGLLKLRCYLNEELTILPPLPSSLRKLDCSECNLTELPPLPEGLVVLSLVKIPSITIPSVFPENLEILVLGNVYLCDVLTSLPSKLRVLSCNYCKLTSLPPLPEGLQSLDCGGNQLTSLPKLPVGLKVLNCWSNQLTSLPLIPESLTKLNCSGNSLSSDITALENSAQYVKQLQLKEKEQADFKKTIEKLLKEIEQLNEYIRFAPGGVEFLKAKGSFEEHVRELNK